MGKSNATDFHERVSVTVDDMNRCLLTRSTRSCVYDASLQYGRKQTVRSILVVVVVYFSDMFHLIQYRNKHAEIGTQPSYGLQVTLIQILTEGTWICTLCTVLQTALMQT